MAHLVCASCRAILGVFPGPYDSHGACEACAALFMAELDRLHPVNDRVLVGVPVEQ